MLSYSTLDKRSKKEALASSCIARHREKQVEGRRLSYLDANYLSNQKLLYSFILTEENTYLRFEACSPYKGNEDACGFV